ncbi:Stealth CR1 domain-containing protein [Nocardioides sp. DS6]|uniref:Stealth CR1 domain-containing protein n=1 Tax=Nocardioides eburneus TaxID=3231482 RepID=A0ABV3SU45_9ACTN
MRVTYLLSADPAPHAVAANRALVDEASLAAAAGHAVTLVGLTRPAPRTLAPGIAVVGLLDRADDCDVEGGVSTEPPSILVPPQWEDGFGAGADPALRQYLTRLDTDVLVTAGPGLVSAAARLAPETTTLVYQEHRLPSEADLDPVAMCAARIDLVLTTSPATFHWLRAALAGPAGGSTGMPVELVPDVAGELTAPYRPRSTLASPLIVAAGGPSRGASYTRLVAAFGQIAADLPDWRLRILDEGRSKGALLRPIRKWGLYDRVELPAAGDDLAAEWARGAFSVHVSPNAEVRRSIRGAMAAGLPAVAFDHPSGARHLIDHGVNGLLVSPDSVPGMASALHRLAVDADLRHRLGERALTVVEQYDAAAVLAARTHLYDRARSRQRATVSAGVVSTASVRPTRAVPDLTPQQARTLALTWAAGAAQSAAPESWFVVPPGLGDPATVVLPMEARPAFLDALGRPEAPVELSLVDPGEFDWPFRRGPVAELAAEIRRGRTPHLRLEPWPGGHEQPGVLAQGCAVAIEFWERSPQGDLVAARRNRFVQSVSPAESFVSYDVEGVTVRTLPLMTRPTVHECHFPIDVVYTWVDGGDPAWEASRAERLADLEGTAATRESSGRARFVSRDELRYSMRSVHLFAPWVRRIHLVTASQVPTWLVDHPKVRLVDHKEILPPEALPTFNSHAIEAALHKIPDLAEHWIYLNDDVFLGRPLSPETFFTPAGQPKVLLDESGVGDVGDPRAKPWLKAAWNNRELLADAVGAINILPLRHVPHPQRTCVVAELEARFPAEFLDTLRAPFRSDTDISVLASLAQHFGLATGQAVVGTAEDTFLDISTSGVLGVLRRLLDRQNDFFCLGDHHDHALPPDRLHTALEDFLADYFPLTAPWERT